MKKIIFLLPVVLLAAAGYAQQSKKPLAIGDDAPEFKVAHWLKNASRATVERGNVNVVEFWATWCGPCLAGVPHLSKIAEEYQSKEVKVFGISVLERRTTDLDSLKRFMLGAKGQQMHYIVGADDSNKFMSTNWMRATGHGGIPFAMVVDKQGKIAWMGHPLLMDKPLEQIVNGSWDLGVARARYLEDKRLDSIDNSIIPHFNTFMGKDYASGLMAIDSLLKREPALKYRYYTAHFTFACLLMTDPGQAVAYARKAWAANDIPNWKGVSDMVGYGLSKGKQFPASVYQLAVDALDAQLSHYPWAMNFPTTYDEMAGYEYLSGNSGKAVEYENKAIDLVKNDPKQDGSQLAKLQGNLTKYKGTN